MAQWEIRLINQGPVRVDVEEERNLCDEYEAFEAYQQHARWRFWRSKSPYWRVTDAVVLHRDVIVGVLPRKAKPRRTIGFLPGD